MFKEWSNKCRITQTVSTLPTIPTTSITIEPITIPTILIPTTTEHLTTTTTSANVVNTYRLPTYLKPYLYELEIQPYVGNNVTYKEKAFTFTGTVIIHFTCIEETDKIVLHSKELDIKNYSLASNNPEISLENFDIDPETDFFTLYANDTFQKNSNYSVKIQFSGVILDKLYGFYRSSYTNKIDNQVY